MHELPPQAIPATSRPERYAFYDATTENRQLITPGELTPLPPTGDQPQFRSSTAAKDGALQYLGFSKTLILGGAGNNIQFLDLAAKATIAVPAPTRKLPLLMSPAFVAHLVDGPTTTDLPGHLYESYIDFNWISFIRPWFTMDVGFTPGIYGDYSFINSKTWRFQGRLIAIFTTSSDAQWIIGITYLDREDVRFLPVAGFIWTPNPLWTFELVAPRPKISRQLSVSRNREWRGYVGGEFGGNSFSILRTTGYQDVATYHDLRLLLGVERKKLQGRTIFWEAGFVFARKLEYLSGTPSIEPGPTALFRAGAYY